MAIFCRRQHYSLLRSSGQVPNFNQIWNFSTDFHERSQYQISRKSVQWEPRWYMLRDWRTYGKTDERTFGRTDMKKAIGTSRKYANASKVHIFLTPCKLVDECNELKEGTISRFMIKGLSLQIYPQGGRSMLFRNVGTYLRVYMISRLRRKMLTETSFGKPWTIPCK